MTHMIQSYCAKHIISKRFFVMDIVVRYCSKTKFGNTRRIAEAIGDGIDVKAVSIADEPKLKEKVRMARYEI